MSLTNLQALQSMVELVNDALYEKVLIDRGVAGSELYTQSNEQVLDLCLCDIYLHLISHPELKQASSLEKYDAKKLRGLRKELLLKHGIITKNTFKDTIHTTNKERMW